MLFLMALDNNNKLVSLNSLYIEKVSVYVNIFTEEKISFNSVFIDRSGEKYRGIGVNEDMPDYIYNYYEKSELEILLIELLTELLNRNTSLINLDKMLFKKLYLKTDRKTISEVNRISTIMDNN